MNPRSVRKRILLLVTSMILAWLPSSAAAQIVPVLTGITIAGPASLNEGASSAYTLTASYDNATTATVTGVLSLEATSFATLSGSTLIAAILSANQAVTLNASYTENGVTVTASKPVTVVNLGTTVRMHTVLGDVDIQLFDIAAPLTVANFITYVNSGAYVNSFIHRSVPGFIIQGGGFVWNGATNTYSAVATNPPVVNEFSPSRSNLRGTIAMAKLGTDPNSATSQWFFNLADNAANLDNQNGGFTVFGQVIGNGMQVVDAIASLPRVNAGAPFDTLPLAQPLTSGFHTENLVIVSSVAVLAPPAAVSLSSGSINFANQTVGVTSAARTITLTNPGSSALTLSSLAITGGAGDFALTGAGTCGATLAANASCTVVVTFTPSAIGARTGTLSIASNAIGSPHTAALTGTGMPVVPGAPTIGTATAGNAAVTVSFTAPANNGGAAVTSYTVTSSPGGLTGTGPVSPITVNGLTNGIGYTFTVTATNSGGTGLPSAPSNTVTPTAPDTASPSVPTILTATAVGGAQINITWTASADNVGVTQYKVYRGGVQIAIVGGLANGYSDIGLAPLTLYSYTVQACDAAANCSAQSGQASATTLAAGQFMFVPQLESGFNLGSNALNATLDVIASFGNQDAPVSGVTSNIVSVWKWNAVMGRWAFFSPQLTGAANASYAAGHNFEVLAAVNPGEGYWVNAINAITLPAQNGTAFAWNGFNFTALPSGFNLIAQASAMTPSQFNALVSQTPPSPGVIPTDNFVSLWVWDAVAGKWYFYSPLLESSGGLPAVKAYADSHNYLHFQDYNKMLGIGTGFWVNRP